MTESRLADVCTLYFGVRDDEKAYQARKQLAPILDKRLLDLLQITPETPLNISTDGKTLFVGPTSATRQGKFEAALDDTVTKYGRMLKRLSE